MIADISKITSKPLCNLNHPQISTPAYDSRIGITT